MQLTRKLTLAHGLAVTMVLAAAGVFQVQRELRSFEQDTWRDHHALMTALSSAAAEVQRLGGAREAQDVVIHANTTRAPVEIRWLTDAREAKVPLAALQAVKTQNEVHAREPGTRAFVLYKPVATSATGAILELWEPVNEMRDFTRTTVVSVALTTLVIGLLLILLAHLLGARIVGKPVARLVDKARRVGSGDLTQPVEVPESDEFGLLAREMNAMCDGLGRWRETATQEFEARMLALEQLRHSDRLATAGKLAAGIAHELGTPLNVVSGRARLISSDELDDEETHDSARVIEEQAERMAHIIRQLLDFARVEHRRTEKADLRDVAHEVCALLRPTSEKKGVELVYQSPPKPVEAVFSWSHVLQAVMNLVVNAVQAAPSGSQVILETQLVRTSPPPGHGDPSADWASLAVHDSGPGMTAEVAARVFEPFFTTKGVGEGTGLGLSVAYGIAHEHGGWIDLSTSPKDGSTFSLYLPAVCGQAATTKAA